jgi:hypothetical protein
MLTSIKFFLTGIKKAGLGMNGTILTICKINQLN